LTSFFLISEVLTAISQVFAAISEVCASRVAEVKFVSSATSFNSDEEKTDLGNWVGAQWLVLEHDALHAAPIAVSFENYFISNKISRRTR